MTQQNPIVGTGQYQYEVLHNWLTPPDTIRWGDTHGVAQDKAGRIYIGHTVGEGSPTRDAIAVFDDHGKFITSWGAAFAGGSHGLDLRQEGSEEFIYHCDTNRRLVVKTSLTGQVVWEKGVPTEAGVYAENDPYIPTNCAFAPNGDFYVTDGYGSDWITQYTRDGTFIRVFGGKGKEPGKVLNAHGIWVDTRKPTPELVVADRANNRLQFFTLDGQHLRFVTDGMRQPCHFDIQGDLLLIPDLSSVVTILGKDDRVVAHLGDGHPTNLRGRPSSEFIPGKFVHPHGARFLHDGSILVAEWVPQGRVTLLRRMH